MGKEVASSEDGDTGQKLTQKTRAKERQGLSGQQPAKALERKCPHWGGTCQPDEGAICYGHPWYKTPKEIPSNEAGIKPNLETTEDKVAQIPLWSLTRDHPRDKARRNTLSSQVETNRRKAARGTKQLQPCP